MRDRSSFLRGATINLRDTIGVTLLSSYLFLKQFYIWESGLPQPADLLLLLFLVHGIVTTRGSVGRASVAGLALLFGYWTAIVNITAAVVIGAPAKLLAASIMNIYNALALALALNAIRENRERYSNAIQKSSTLALIAQAAIVAIAGATWGNRAMGTFNNPNQLAFFAVLYLALVLLVRAHDRASLRWTFVACPAAMYCSVASLSRAGMVAVGVMIVGSLLSPPSSRGLTGRYRLAVVGASIVSFATIAGLRSQTIVSWYERIANRANIDDISARGLDRLSGYPQYWFFGSGEGEYWRFDSPLETHSLLLNMQISYGIVGLAIFGLLLYGAFRPSIRSSWHILLGIMIFGLGHNGIRHTVLWILLGLMAATSHLREPLQDAHPAHRDRC